MVKPSTTKLSSRDPCPLRSHSVMLVSVGWFGVPLKGRSMATAIPTLSANASQTSPARPMGNTSCPISDPAIRANTMASTHRVFSPVHLHVTVRMKKRLTWGSLSHMRGVHTGVALAGQNSAPNVTTVMPPARTQDRLEPRRTITSTRPTATASSSSSTASGAWARATALHSVSGPIVPCLPTFEPQYRQGEQ